MATSGIAVRIHCKELGPRPGAQWCCVCLMLLLLLLLSGEGLRWWRDLSPPTSWLSVATAPPPGSGSVTE